MLSRFHLIAERNGHTDRRTATDRCDISISRVSMLTRNKNEHAESFCTEIPYFVLLILHVRNGCF